MKVWLDHLALDLDPDRNGKNENRTDPARSLLRSADRDRRGHPGGAGHEPVPSRSGLDQRAMDKSPDPGESTMAKRVPPQKKKGQFMIRRRKK